MNYGNLIPRPVKAEFRGDGFFMISGSIRLEAAGILSEVLPVATDICTGMGFTLTSDCERAISFKEDAQIADSEGYILDINQDVISIRACSPAGAFYALQTLRQFSLDSFSGDVFPVCHIEDKPQYRWRGLMFDCARNFFPVSFIYKIIDAAALHKLNVFHWHLSDDQGWRLPVTGYPLLTEIGGWRIDRRTEKFSGKIGGSYTEQEIRDIVAYAAQRYMTVVPEIDMPGHMSALLAAYPGFGCTGGPYRVEDRFGIFDDVLCIGNPKLFDVVEAIFDSVVSLFPAPYVHIGGDECPRTRWQTCPKCKQKVKELGLPNTERLQPWFTAQLAKLLENKGKAAIGWDEVLENATELPDSLIVQSWRGVEGGRQACMAGHRVIMSPTTQGCYLDYRNYDDPMEIGRQFGTATVKNSYDFSVVPEGLPACASSLILGGQGNLWTEEVYNGRTAEYLLFPRLSALAEALWLPPDDKDFASFAARLEAHKERLRKLHILYYDGLLE